MQGLGFRGLGVRGQACTGFGISGWVFLTGEREGWGRGRGGGGVGGVMVGTQVPEKPLAPGLAGGFGV